jgi:deoxyribodipyrimidine photo-lyase
MSNKESKKYNHTLFIFRRDYRVTDNTTLLEACKNSNYVIPIFIFTHKQIDDKQNKLKSHNCVKFLVESLEELNSKELSGKLRIFYGDEMTIIAKLLKNNTSINCIAFNRDYTSYAQLRDAEITKIAKHHSVEILTMDDALLFPLGSIKTTSGTTYMKYTPYYRKAIQIKPRKADLHTKPKNIASRNKVKLEGYKEYTAPLNSFYDVKKVACGCGCNKLIEKPGRKAGLVLLKELASGKWNNYEDCRNILIYNTTHLSAYNKFGCVSIREVYEAALKGKKNAKDSGIIAQLIWRDFFYNLSSEYPEIYKYERNGVDNRKIKWVKDEEKLTAWKEGRTGFPIVDACMNELNKTGYLHNRGRLIVSNFLTRLLHQNWHEGEYHFARVLYDYDPAQNSFGWQISASISGTASRPINQNIYNPWIQSLKFDKDGKYIKKWIPELENVEARKLHKWDKYWKTELEKGIKYISPIIDYSKEREFNLKLIK